MKVEGEVEIVAALLNKHLGLEVNLTGGKVVSEHFSETKKSIFNDYDLIVSIDDLPSDFIKLLESLGFTCDKRGHKGNSKYPNSTKNEDNESEYPTKNKDNESEYPTKNENKNNSTKYPTNGSFWGECWYIKNNNVQIDIICAGKGMSHVYFIKNSYDLNICMVLSKYENHKFGPPKYYGEIVNGDRLIIKKINRNIRKRTIERTSKYVSRGFKSNEVPEPKTFFKKILRFFW